MRDVSITDGSVLLRPPVLEDAEAVLQAAQDPDVSRWTSVPWPYRRSDAEQWLSVEVPAGWRSGAGPVWLVCRADAPQDPLGSIGLHAVDLEQRTAEVGYWTAAPARGRGLTTDALRLLCRWAFDELDLERIEWQAYLGNDASRRVAEKVGFRVEGTTRDRLVAHGRSHAGWYAGLLPSDLCGGLRLVESRWGPEQGAAPTAPAPDDAPVAPPDTEITAGTIHLRRWRETDLADLAPAIDDPDIDLWNPFTVDGGTTETARRWLASRADWGDGRHASFASLDATTGALLGGVSLYRIDRGAASAEVGYWTMPAARGRGATRTAVGAVTRWAFAVLGLHRVELWHGVENAASCAVARRAGFALEAAARASYRYGDGVRHDDHLHARLDTDT